MKYLIKSLEKHQIIIGILLLISLSLNPMSHTFLGFSFIKVLLSLRVKSKSFNFLEKGELLLLHLSYLLVL